MNSDASIYDTGVVANNHGSMESSQIVWEKEHTKVVVIQEDAHVSTLLQFIFEREGYEVTVLSDGYKAMQYVQDPDSAPSIIVLDIVLPIIDGYDVMRAIKARQSWKNVPLVVLSARNNESDVMRAFSSGAADYIAKPFQLGEMLARVKRLV